MVEGIAHKIDVHDLEPHPAGELGLNDIGRVTLRISSLLVAHPTRAPHHRQLLLIDESTNDTVGAGMVVESPG